MCVEYCKGRELLCVEDWLAMENSASNGRVQNLFVMRHGERMDDAEPTWLATATRPWDPPLTEKGHLQAQEKGKKLRSEGFLVTRILVSPFLRCVQTTAAVIKGMYPDGTANSNLKVGHTQFLISSHSSFLIFLMMLGKVQAARMPTMVFWCSEPHLIYISLRRHVDVRMQKLICAIRSLLNFYSRHTHLS